MLSIGATSRVDSKKTWNKGPAYQRLRNLERDDDRPCSTYCSWPAGAASKGAQTISNPAQTFRSSQIKIKVESIKNMKGNMTQPLSTLNNRFLQDQSAPLCPAGIVTVRVWKQTFFGDVLMEAIAT